MRRLLLRTALARRLGGLRRGAPEQEPDPPASHPARVLPERLEAGPRPGESIAEWRRWTLTLIPTEVLRRGNADIIPRLLSRDYRLHDVPTGLEARGPHGYRGLVADLRHAFPDLTAEIEQQTVDENRVRTRFRVRATFAGSYHGRKPTGERIELTATLVSRFDGARLSEEWVHYDRDLLRRELRAHPPRPSGRSPSASSP